MKKIIIIIVVVMIGVSVVSCFHYWKKNVEEREHRYLLTCVESALKKNDTEEAVNVSAYHGLFVLSERNLPKELRAAIWKSAISTRSPMLLQKLAVEDPGYLKVSEGAAVEWARMLIYLRREQFCSEVIAYWTSRQGHDEAIWKQLLAEREIVANERNEAIRILESIELPSSQTYQWLALLNSSNRLEAGDYLLAAYREDNYNPDTRLFLANLYETNGDISKARQLYVSAVTLSEGNPIHRNALSDFYIRRGNHTMAIDSLCRASTNLPGILWLKAAFWSRVTGRGPDELPSPEDSLALEYRDDLAKSIEVIPLLGELEYFKWLYLLNCVSEGRYDEAYRCLLSLPESSRSIAGGLRQRLELIFRDYNDEQPLGTRLGIAVAFMEQGWLKAGIELCSEVVDRKSLPDDMRFKLAKSCQRLGMYEEASSWVKEIEIAPELRMLSAELDFYNDEAPRGWSTLLTLSNEAHNVAEKARQLIALVEEKRNL